MCEWNTSLCRNNIASDVELAVHAAMKNVDSFIPQHDKFQSVKTTSISSVALTQLAMTLLQQQFCNLLTTDWNFGDFY